ncbi:MAG TPA: NmrA family NAD(P)-binding protein [Gemmatimonadaceae bacterium]|nr:NmrA family NAD(P)-binding protein [Gemmatimonadaceae bacterium]
MILVAGATGVLGTEIVRRLTARGNQVRALTRTTSAPEKVERLKRFGAQIMQGDVRDPRSLIAACAGVNAVISTVTTILTSQAGDSFEATDGEGNKSLIDAARKAGVEKFVFVSFDTTKSPDNPLTRAKIAAEEHLKASGLDYTILHPTFFCESWLGPMLFADPDACTAKVYGKGTQKFRYVTVGDVAEFAVQSLGNPTARNAVIPVGGPEEISQREAVILFEQAFGKRFNVIEVPEATLEAQWSAAENPFDKTFAGLMLGMARGFDSGARPPFSEFPMQMTSVRDYIKNLAGGGVEKATPAARELPPSDGHLELR